MGRIQKIKRSIEHWERMIKWVETQSPEDTAYFPTMEYLIGESWTLPYCDLCNEYYNPKEKNHCQSCPLYENFGSCFDESSANCWTKVEESLTWGEWLENARNMLKQLKSLL